MSRHPGVHVVQNHDVGCLRTRRRGRRGEEEEGEEHEDEEDKQDREGDGAGRGG